MSRRLIPNLIALEARNIGETVTPVVVASGELFHTLVLEPTDINDVAILCTEGYLESYVVLSRSDGQGDYVSALVTSAQLKELGTVNNAYRLVERGGLRAAVLEDYPEWAKNDAGAAHVFFGVPVTTASGVSNE